MDGEKYNMKMAVISGASHALDYKNRNIRATDEEIIQHVTDQVEKILKKIENQEEE